MSNDKPYAVITSRILEALERGVVPWRKPWSLPAGMRPRSVTGHAYKGVNAVLLGLSGYSDPRWLTYRKALELNGHVRKGEKSTPVALWKPVERVLIGLTPEVGSSVRQPSSTAKRMSTRNIRSMLLAAPGVAAFSASIFLTCFLSNFATGLSP